MDVKNIRVSTHLTGFVRDYNFNAEGTWLQDKIAPVKPCKSSSYTYKYYGNEALEVDVSDIKAAKGLTNEVDYDVAEGSGTIPTYALKKFVSDQEIAEAPDVIKPLEDAAVFVTKLLKLRQEIRIVTLMEACTNSGAVTQVFDHASATPVADIGAAKLALLAACGRPADTFVLGYDTAEEMSTGVGLWNYMKTQNFTDYLTAGADMLKNRPFLGMNVLISSALKESADPGITSVPAWVYNTSVYVLRAPTNIAEAPWGIQPEAAKFVITKWRDDDRGGWYVKAQWIRTIKEVSSTAIYEITGATD